MALYDNFPYTNFHELNLDWIVKTVKQIADEWNNLSGDIQATAVESDVATVTVTGSLQEGLTFNFGLPRGAAGQDGTDGNGIASAYLDPNTYTLTLTFTDGTTYTTPSIRGEQGPQGPTGQGIDIVGTVASTSDLPATGQPGKAYMVGTSSPYTLYVWASGANAWQEAGSMGSSVSPSAIQPLMDGIASIGQDAGYSRGDHRHPTDTSRQATLVSGQNIKTVNNTTLLGSGNVAVQPTLESGSNIKKIRIDSSDYDLLASPATPLSVQAPLVSGTNIKTINTQSLLGSGNLQVQSVLVSGTSLATVNGSDLLQGGNVRTVHVYSGTADPNTTEPTGCQDGDIYIKLEA